MPEVIAFDTLAYARKLKSVGFTEDQAEVQAEALVQIIDERLATKQDIFSIKRDIEELKRDMKEMDVSLKRNIKEMYISLRRDMKGMDTSLKRDMKEMDTSLKRDMKEMELRLKHDLTLRLGAMMTAGIAIIAALVKLL